MDGTCWINEPPPTGWYWWRRRHPGLTALTSGISPAVTLYFLGLREWGDISRRERQQEPQRPGGMEVLESRLWCALAFILGTVALGTDVLALWPLVFGDGKVFAHYPSGIAAILALIFRLISMFLTFFILWDDEDEGLD